MDHIARKHFQLRPSSLVAPIARTANAPTRKVEVGLLLIPRGFRLSPEGRVDATVE
jgi:hypothetical protein